MNKSKIARIKIKIFGQFFFLSIIAGTARIDTPKIRPIFALTDPIALPIARPMLPSPAPMV